METATQYAVCISDLRIDYGSHVAVKDMNLDIPQGVIYGLVGPNGAGKTSTFKALTSLLEPTNGHISINGHDIVKKRRHAQTSIGYMPDLAPVASDLRVWEFLDLFAACHGLEGKAKKNRVNECLALVELSDKRNDNCKSLSRGMMQRLVLAKTMLHRPSLLILDEPASGMDVRSRVSLRRILRQVSDEGATVMVSSHILPELSEMCDMIGILHHGQLLETGTVDEVMHRMTSLLPHIHLTLASPASLHWESWLKSKPKVKDVHVHSSLSTSFVYEGDNIELSNLLMEAMQSNHPICRVTEQRHSLEQILMELEEEEYSR
ncbi:vitamin B12 import ATP-binding protein BtuD [Rubritalea halochordaticola]|uniref:Vitamin B12 import ATP-binding protein BtuD n=1 Tax=Rubritalea halochordaticola TaxID=714537 RepID=A0ABP9UXP7_9BACT